ncbi:MAG: MFS transporter [Clostridia bacterium]|nr:MFS transporter [Clostridia bacterium]
MIQSSRNVKMFSALCCLLYFASYLTRINYGAIIAEIVSAKDILKSEAGIVSTVSFFTYGVGQILSGVLSDRFNARRILLMGVFTTAVINIAMPFCRTITLMTLLWGINGFVQACIWPPMAKIMAQNLTFYDFKKLSINITMSASVATMAVYVAAPVIIRVSTWENVFFTSAGVTLVISVLWCAFTRGMKSNGERVSKDKTAKMPMRLWFTSGALFSCVVLVFVGILRNGITTWLPSFMVESFDIGNAAAILTTAVLPCLAVLSTKLVGYIYMRFIHDEMVLATLLCVVMLLSCAAAFLWQESIVFCVSALAVITAAAYGANMILTALLPPYYSKYGHISTVTGVLNSMPYVGATISSWGIAKISESEGWSFTLLLWGATALAGVVFCAANMRRWSIFRKNTIKGDTDEL